MEYIQRLLAEWSKHACGMTVDLVGEPETAPQLQWVLAFPLQTDPEHTCTMFLDQLRQDLETLGLQSLNEAPGAGTDHVHLPNGHVHEMRCPYRPESCTGEHLLATGRGEFVGAGQTSAS